MGSYVFSMSFSGVRPGNVLNDKYQIDEILGEGGMGLVYKAHHLKHPDFLVAIKLLTLESVKQLEMRDRFSNEVIAGYRVSHKNVVQMYEYFDQGVIQGFAMELLEGGSLQDRLDQGPISWIEAVDLIRQISLGLEALHVQGTVHRDLKPDNILFNREGVPKITDFGVALVRGGIPLESEGMLAGTPKYLSAEYIETKNSDHRADIYALGVMAYEIIAGRSPFTATEGEALLREHFEVRGDDLASVIPEIPEELAQIVARCMQPLEQRFQRAQHIADQMLAIQKSYKLIPEEGDQKAQNQRIPVIQLPDEKGGATQQNAASKIEEVSEITFGLPA